MQKLLKQLSYFILGFITISVIIKNILPENKYWGNEEYQSKIETFKKQKYNTVFFGSSRILTGINPKYLDSLVNGTDNIKSYNLATTGTWSNETFYIYEQFLNDVHFRQVLRLSLWSFRT